MVELLTRENFDEEVMNSKVPVVIDFYADWCMPCRMMAPVFESLSKEFEGKVKFLKLDTQAQNQIAGAFRVQSIPTLSFVKDGKEVDRSVGLLDEDSLRDVLKKLL